MGKKQKRYYNNERKEWVQFNRMNKKDALHYLKVLKKDSNVFQFEIREAIDMGIKALENVVVTEELLK